MKFPKGKLLLILILLQLFLTLAGCSSARYKLQDWKQRFLTDIMRW